jgi:hypothetical protein
VASLSVVSDFCNVAVLIAVMESSVGCGKFEGRTYTGKLEVYILKGIGRFVKSR